MTPIRLVCLCTALGCIGPVHAADFDAAAATNRVGLDLYRQLATKDPGANLVLSPYSIQSALALVYAGADGGTRTEMSRALHLPAEEASVQSAFAGLRAALERLATPRPPAADARRRSGGDFGAIEWHAANRLFGQAGFAFRDSFLALMTARYAAPFDPLDFSRDAEAARGTINRWVEDRTQAKIRDLIPRGALGADTRLVLVNALYLKAPWQKPFEKTATRPRPFHPAAAAARDVPTMHTTNFLGYARGEGFTLVALPYIGRELQFLILLPDEGRTPEEIAARLTPADFARWADLNREATTRHVSLHLPRFRADGITIPLGQSLRALGIRSAFDEPPQSANFDRIAPRRPDNYLKLSDVFHQSFIAVDEEGTEAAAATAASIALAAAALPAPPVEVRVDRPFLFAIQHRASGACLFLGRIADPR